MFIGPKMLRAVATLTFVFAVSFTSEVFATDWNALTGNWSVAGNWTPAVVPTSGAVNIVFTNGTARTVTFDVASVSLGLATIDLTGSGTTTNTLSMTGNTFRSSGLFVGGYNGITGVRTNGRGDMTQSGGLVQMNGLTDIALANGTGSTGTYTLSGSGSIIAPQSIFIGYQGTGTFNQSAGTTTTLQSSAVGTLNLGAIAGSSGTYNLSGGTLTSNVDEIVGEAGSGFFIQSGGTNTIQNGKNLYLGRTNGGSGTYTLTGSASVTVANHMFVGNSATGVGTLNIQGNSTVWVGDQFWFDNGAVNMSGGTLRFNQWVPAGATWNYTGGTIQMAGDRNIGTSDTIQAIFGATPTIPTGKGLTIEGVGTISTNTNISGGKVTIQSGSGPITYQAKIGTTNSITVNVTADGDLAYDHAAVLLGNDSGTSVNLNVSGFGSTVTMTDQFFIGYSGVGRMNITSRGSVTTNGDAQIASPGTQGVVTLTDAGSIWTIGARLTVGHGADGTLNIGDGTTVSVAGEVVAGFGGSINVNGGTLRLGNFGAAHQFANLHFNYGTLQFAGTRTIGTDAGIAAYFGAAPVLTAGKNLTVEGTALLNAPMTLNGGIFRAQSLAVNNTLQFLGGTLQIDGGSISNITSLNIPTNGQLVVRGTQALSITGAAGSTINCTGITQLGDATAVNGFATQGNVLVGQTVLTLNDANDVVFDALSYTSIGNGVNGGVINATNGLTLNFGGNIVGFGNINSTNASNKPLINNGHITGQSPTFRISLSGYVKGVGTFDNVTTTGTFSPGLSPAIVQTTNLAIGSTGTLLMELGGTAVGSGYDQVQDAGALTLGGTLQVSLINGFTPTVGSSFDLLNWSMLSGTFASLSLSSLAGGLTWNTSQLYTTGVLSIAAAAGITGDFNNNGIVDAADYVVWRNNVGTSNVLPNDPTGGTIGNAQYNTWRAHFGQTAGSGTDFTSNAAVPEPATASIFTIALIAGFVIRRRRSSIRH